MSTWIEIKKQEDVEFDSTPMTEDAIDIFIAMMTSGTTTLVFQLSL